MVKAYLKYVQHDVIGGLSGNLSNIITCQLYNSDGSVKGSYIVSACNEVVNFSHIKKGHIEFKIYDKEAQYGQVTCLATSNEMLAIGYSNGSILIYGLQLEDNELKQIHSYSFHRSSVSQIIFFSNDTQMASGSSDTYIVIYDLIADTAQFKLMGHSDIITALSTFNFTHPIRGDEQTILVSGSKDGLLKFWDLQQQSCILTASDQYMSKIEHFTIISELKLIIVGSSDNQLKLFKVAFNQQEMMLEAHLKSTLKKDSNSKVLEIHYHEDLKILTVLSSDNKFEIFKLNIDKEDSLIKKILRQEKRKALKRKKQEDEENQEIPILNIDKESIIQDFKSGNYDLSIHFSKRLSLDLNTKSKAESVCLILRKDKKLKQGLNIFITFHSNQIYQYVYDLGSKKNEDQGIEIKKVFGEMESHKLPIRNVQVSGNDRMMTTASFDSVKVWNIDFSSQQQELKISCQASIDYQNVLSVVILTGNKYIVVGTKEGTLGLYELQTNEFIHEVAAHNKEIWELSMHTNPQTKEAKGNLLIASCSADKSIKFWTLTQSHNKDSKIQLQLYEKIETTDEVMGIKFTPDGKYFVFSLLDQTMKVCYLDSMKLSLNLYGHKLPILSFDISSDNSLLVSASADKNIKIWGMDFGDIHKSIFAHQDSITCVKFIRDTHYFMSCSKDREVKFFDGDTYDEVFVFDNFFGEVWGIATSSIGDFFLTVSADKAIRVWRQTQEQVFVEEERERRDEKFMLKEAEQEYQEIDIYKSNQIDPFSRDKVVKIETAAASKRTAENLKYGEDLMEAIELAEGFRSEIDQYEIQLEDYQNRMKHNSTVRLEKPAKPKPNVMFNNKTIFDHVLLHLKSIKISEIENTLRFLNFKQSQNLLFYLEHFIRNNIEIERASKFALYIIETYQSQIQTTLDLQPIIKSISMHMRYHFKNMRDVIGMNISALKLVQKEVQYLLAGGSSLPIVDFGVNGSFPF